METTDHAIDWYLKNRLQPLSAGEREDFTAWLRASPLNVREYLAISALSKDLPAAADASPQELEGLIVRGRTGRGETVVPMPASMRPVPKRAVALKFAAVFALVCAGAAWWWFAPETYGTGHGERRTVRLEDGSLMHMNSDSRVSVDYSKEGRDIRLRGGQILIDVAPDPARPLRVITEGVQVRAVGTQFDVYRKPDSVVVTVVEGRVVCDTFSMVAGEQLTLGSTARPQVVPADLSIATAWLQGNIKFARQPLGEVAAEFNRYSPVPVDIEGAALRNLRVSGIFNAYDTDSFVEFIRRMDDVEVEKSARRIRVSARQER